MELANTGNNHDLRLPLARGRIDTSSGYSARKSSLFPLWSRFQLPVLVLSAVGAFAVWEFIALPSQLLNQARKIADQQPAKAEELLERCLTSRPGYAEAQLLRCHVLGLLSQWDEAYGMFHLIKHPEALPASQLVEVASQAINARQFQLAGLILEAARRSDPSSVRAARLSLDLCLREGRKDQALRVSLELEKLNSQDALPWQIIASACQEQKNLTKGAAAFQKVLSFQEKLGDQNKTRVQLARILLDLGRIDEARNAIAPVLDQTIPPLDALFIDATVKRFTGHPQDALKVVQRILDDHPDFVAAIYLRGLLQFDHGNFIAARDDFTRVIELDPSGSEAHFKLGQTCQRLGDSVHAATEMSLSKSLSDDRDEFDALQSKISPGNNQESQRKQLKVWSQKDQRR